MVRHDEIDAELSRERRLLDGGDAAVDAHDDLGAVLRELPERRRVQAVALLVAVRDVRADDDAELAERAHEDRRAGDAVDVVVPVDDDALASRERTTEPLDRAIEVESSADPLRSAAPPGRQTCRRPRGRGKRAPERQARGYHPGHPGPFWA